MESIANYFAQFSKGRAAFGAPSGSSALPAVAHYDGSDLPDYEPDEEEDIAEAAPVAKSTDPRRRIPISRPVAGNSLTKKRTHNTVEEGDGPVVGSSSILTREGASASSPSSDHSDVSFGASAIYLGIANLTLTSVRYSLSGFKGFKTRRSKRQRIAGDYTGEVVAQSGSQHLAMPDVPTLSSLSVDAVHDAHASPTSSLASYESDHDDIAAPNPVSTPIASAAPSSARPSARWNPSLFPTTITFADNSERYDPLSAPIKYANPDASRLGLDADTTVVSTTFEADDSHRTDSPGPYNDLESHQYRSVDELKVATSSHEHHVLYWEDGDVIIHCGAVIFRVHAEVLVEHSWMYREMLGQDGGGTTMSAQRELPGVKVYIHDEGVSGETVEDYEFLFMCFYRP